MGNQINVGGSKPRVDIAYTTNALPPTLTTLGGVPLLMSGSGGQVKILNGTNLTGVTAVSVSGTACTSISSTATTVTFTVPTKTASATPYNITVTTGGGAATLTNAIYALPTSIGYAWYAPDYNAGAGTWADLIGGVVADNTTAAMTAPTKTTNWINGQPAVTSAAASGLRNTTLANQAQPFSMFAVFDRTGDATNKLLFDSEVPNECGMFGGAANIISIYAGGTGVSTKTTDSTPALYELFFNSSSSTVTKNNDTPSSASCGTNSMTGITILAKHDATSTWPGSMGLIMRYAGTPSAGDRTIIHGIAQAIYGTA